MTDRHDLLPPEQGVIPSESDPDPAPERDESPAITDPRDRGGTGAPVGANNILEGRVNGVMTPPAGSHGQGEGG
jgi:hypothetical protein